MPEPLSLSDCVAGPAWPGVRILATTRAGGVSRPPYDSLNLGQHVGDDPAAVDANRARLRGLLPGEPRWLRQVHGTVVHDADAPGDARAAVPPEADAAVTAVPGTVLAILTADCLPVVIADRDARALAAAHAGWRGLAAGVLESTVAAMRRRTSGALRAWIGPAIGPTAFEVGEDVREALGAYAPADSFRPVAGRPGKWWCDLPAIAAARLRAAGVETVEPSGLCTVTRDGFYSYRRDGVTGRLATLAWLAGPHAQDAGHPSQAYP